MECTSVETIASLFKAYVARIFHEFGEFHTHVEESRHTRVTFDAPIGDAQSALF